MQIATWNINGIKARLEIVQLWLETNSPDIVCLQEIKSIDENFPAGVFEAMGYNVATHGQKAFNGVAMLSKLPFDEVRRGLPGDKSDEQARFIEGVFSVPSGSLRVAGIYLPNGNPVDSGKFPYKLGWMDRLTKWTCAELALEEPLIVTGDYNIIPQDIDASDPAAWRGDALYHPESVARFRAFSALGLTDAVRAVSGEPDYTYWDFQSGAWRRNAGIRIDHLMVSPQAADRLEGVTIHREARGWDKPSDHVPVVGRFDF
ncbi:MAG TPA: exodeoxyribonuclease III [Devosiaceae bacterium]|nr:exodeoxyribonuclease III [Devosiaceae bacterium]